MSLSSIYDLITWQPKLTACVTGSAALQAGAMYKSYKIAKANIENHSTGTAAKVAKIALGIETGIFSLLITSTYVLSPLIIILPETSHRVYKGAGAMTYGLLGLSLLCKAMIVKGSEFASKKA